MSTCGPKYKQWYASGDVAKTITEEVLPFLVLKKRQASLFLLALKVQKDLRMSKRSRYTQKELERIRSIADVISVIR